MFITINYARKTGKTNTLDKLSELMGKLNQHFHTVGREGMTCFNGNCKDASLNVGEPIKDKKYGRMS